MLTIASNTLFIGTRFIQRKESDITILTGNKFPQAVYVLKICK